MEVIIPCAGYATRLYPLTKNFPKALLEIGGQPVLNYILKKIEEIKDIDKVYLVTNARYYSYFIEWQENQKTNLSIEVINDNTHLEENRLGAMGDINFAIQQKKLKGPLLIIAGDNFFDFSILPMYNYFKKKNKTIISLCKKESLEDLKKGGCASIDKNNKVIFFEEKPENPSSNLYSNCLYIYDKKAVSKVQRYIEESNNTDQAGRFIQWIYLKQEVYGFINSGRLIDIGTPESLEKARKEFKEKN